MVADSKPPRKIKTVGLVAYGLAFSGGFLILLSVIGTDVLHWPIWGAAFVRDLGLLLAAVMAGTILHEKLLRDETFEQWRVELDQQLETKVPKLQEVASETANTIHALFCEKPPQMTGLRRLDEVRRNFAGYYNWVNEQERQELFFAGRSVLHRIDADVRSRTGSSAEDVLFRRLKENSKITILFLDPRIDLIGRLAEEEGEPWQSLLGNIATSIGICKRLYGRLEQNTRMLPTRAQLTIRIYSQVPYFAFHQTVTEAPSRRDEQVIIGFYFLSMEGSSSAAYEVVDQNTKTTFREHFVQIGSKSATTSLLEFDGARGVANFNISLFEELRSFLKLKLGDKAEDLLNGSSNSSAQILPMRNAL